MAQVSCQTCIHLDNSFDESCYGCHDGSRREDRTPSLAPDPPGEKTYDGRVCLSCWCAKLTLGQDFCTGGVYTKVYTCDNCGAKNVIQIEASLENIKKLLSENKKIQAIKLIRYITGNGLKESKAFADTIQKFFMSDCDVDPDHSPAVFYEQFRR